MIIGVPKEIKIQEYRVGLTPEGVDALTRQGHTVNVETKAGLGSGFSDESYIKAGATILATAKEVYSIAEMIIKVKEPLAAEFPLIKPGQILFTYFHFAASKELTEAMMKSSAVCIAYEIDGKRVEEVPASQTDFHHAKPIYEYVDGWKEDISNCKRFEDLPVNAQKYVKFLEKLSGAPMSAIGVGPGRNQTIVVKEFI